MNPICWREFPHVKKGSRGYESLLQSETYFKSFPFKPLDSPPFKASFFEGGGRFVSSDMFCNVVDTIMIQNIKHMYSKKVSDQFVVFL